MQKQLLLTLLSLGCYVFGHAQYFFVKGKVTNAQIEPVSNVNILVKGTVYGTSTDANGYFTLKLEKGNYELIFSHLGYRTYKRNVTLLSNQTVNIILEDDVSSLSEVELTLKHYDKSRDIVREVIRGKEKYIQLSYQCSMYVKATQEDDAPGHKHKKDSAEKALKKWQKDSIREAKELADTTQQRSRKEKKPVPVDPLENIRINFAEIMIEKSYEYPDKIKEVRTGFVKRGNTDALFYLSSTEGEINFYQNLVRINSISESPFQSPLSAGGLLVYKYKLVKSYYEDGLKIYRIRVSPNIIGNALVTGEMDIVDSLWCLKRFHFSFPKFHLAEYDEFVMDASFAPDSMSGLWLCNKQDFSFKTKLGGNKSSGHTVVYYSKYLIRKFERKYFGNEVSSTSQDAYEKDTTFWNSVREEPLTPKEVRFIFVSDSIKAAHSKTEYLDSLDSLRNRVTLAKLFLFGQDRYNRKLEQTWGFDPFWELYAPIAIGGPRIRYGFSYNKIFKNKTDFNNYTSLSYGINNRDFKGNIVLSRLYDPFRRGFLYINVARNFDVINPFDSWLSILRRANFYVKQGAFVYNRIELLNGLYLRTGLQFEQRSSIAGYKFSSYADSIYQNYKYKPASFEEYNAFYTDIIVSYTPFQKYLREPREKVILGSKYPTFLVQWRKGIPGILGGSTQFDYVEYRLEWDFKVGLAGNSKLYVNTGKFYQMKKLQFIDYKYQYRIGPYLFANPLYSFQALDSTYITFDRFYAAHYLHRFNGAILNKIPVLKLLQLTETAGGGMLYSKEHNLFYMEAFAGIEYPFNFINERMRLGLFVVQAVSNNFKSPPQLKFTIEVYDRANNKWNY